ncbi:hypothetical protein EDB87DRAFT_1629782 [Lactarius vividus]|nr:hypothetical protein EDB87DRAFT_1629782 [Lactarius vividus]
MTGAPAQLRPTRVTPIALTDRPAPYRRAESDHDHGEAAVRRGIRLSASPGPATSQPAVQRLTRSQSLAARSRNEEPGTSRSDASTIPTGNSHENEVADGVTGAPNAIQAILDGAGLIPYSLSWGESERANMTPSVRRIVISKTFGGNARQEWFECNLRPNYKYFFRADASAQPFAPTHVGDRGLVLFGPDWNDAAQDEEGRIFHVFVSAGTPKCPTMNYVGDYTKVPLLRTNMEWSLLPQKCQRAWLKRLLCSTTPTGRALHARIELRDILKREPSVAEVRGRLQDGQVIEDIRWQKLSAVFKSGEEKLQVVGIKCERYDAHLASIILVNKDL